MDFSSCRSFLGSISSCLCETAPNSAPHSLSVPIPILVCFGLRPCVGGRRALGESAGDSSDCAQLGGRIRVAGFLGSQFCDIITHICSIDLLQQCHFKKDS